MYYPIIGLEIHLQPKTNSKMFCTCDAKYFGKKPNTHTCPVCLGLPGALPVPNFEAVKKCIKLGLALNCNIASESKFDRKNYFYPDLPKGYQISQYDQPIAYNGFVEIDDAGDAKRIRITRVHMEEDTGKSLHQGEKTLLDFNKSGVPLIEIVTEPDFTSKEEVDAFAKRLRQIIRYCGISDADMEKGQMRYELNISLSTSPIGMKSTKLPNYKIEVKNIGSISVLQKVIEFEIKRQSKILDKGQTPKQETRGLKDMSGATLEQRIKEGSADYRYFPEPDIPPMRFDKKLLEEIKSEIPELPQEKKWRYVNEYKIDPDSAEMLVSKPSFYKYFEEAIEISKGHNAVQIVNWLIGDLRKLSKANHLSLDEQKVMPKHLVELVNLIDEGIIKSAIAKDILTKCFETGKSPKNLVKEMDLKVLDNNDELESIIKSVIQNNPKIVEDLKKNPNASQFLLGQVMRETKGQADPVVTKKILVKLLE